MVLVNWTVYRAYLGRENNQFSVYQSLVFGSEGMIGSLDKMLESYEGYIDSEIRLADDNQYFEQRRASLHNRNATNIDYGHRFG